MTNLDQRLRDHFEVTATELAAPPLDRTAPARRARRRRQNRLAATAFGVVVAIAGVGVAIGLIAGDEEGTARVIDGPDVTVTTTVSTTTTEPTTTSTTVTTPVAASSPPPLGWSSTPIAGFTVQPNPGRWGGFGQRPVVAVADDLLFAVDYDILQGGFQGLLRSSDGVIWEPIPDAGIDVGGVTPSWSDGAEPSDFVATSIGAIEGRLHVLEITNNQSLSPRARVWRTTDGSEWSVVEISASAPDPGLDADIRIFHRAVAADSPEALLVALEYDYSLNWWQFAPEGTPWDVEAEAANHLAAAHADPGEWVGFDPAEPTGFPDDRDGATGLRFSYDPDAPVVPWDEMRPVAQQTWEWWARNRSGHQELYVVGSDGDVSALDQWPFDNWLDEIEWTGTRFVARPISGSVEFSDDGLVWEETPRYPLDVFYAFGVIGDNLLALGQSGLMVSTDEGQTYNPARSEIRVTSLPGSPGGGPDPSGAVPLVDGLGLTDADVSHGVATVLLLDPDTGQWTVLRSTDGLDWSASGINSGLTAEPRLLLVGTDGSVFAYSDGRVDIGRPN